MTLWRMLYLVTLLYFPGNTDGALSLGILHLRNNHRYADVCVAYNPHYSKLPAELKNAPAYPVLLASPLDGCKKQSSRKSLNSVALFVGPVGNCTFFDKLQSAYKSQAKQVILLSYGKANDFPTGTAKQHKNVDLSVAKLPIASWNDVVNTIGMPRYSQLYGPPAPPFDPNLIIIWIIAVFTVVTGAYWAGLRQESESKMAEENGSIDFDDEYDVPQLSPIMILVFIIMICIVLLLLYYFYKYLIYLVIAIFAIACIHGTYVCLSGITSMCTCTEWRVPENNIPLLKSRPRVFSVVLYIFCIGLSAFWVVIRNDKYGWILQDFLGVCLSISFLRIFCMPNLKISAILLSAMLLYDIFFVFITPLFSARGGSIMIQVATGEGSSESLPMVIKIPKLIQTALLLCGRRYSLVGLGDILLPGVFVSFCHSFDVAARTKTRVYFITSSVGYAFGLFMAFFVLVLMKSGQPALLYLSPSVLLAVTIAGGCRGELKELWHGEIDLEKRGLLTDSAEPIVEKDECNKGYEKDGGDTESLTTN